MGCSAERGARRGPLVNAHASAASAGASATKKGLARHSCLGRLGRRLCEEGARAQQLARRRVARHERAQQLPGARRVGKLDKRRERLLRGGVFGDGCVVWMLRCVVECCVDECVHACEFVPAEESNSKGRRANTQGTLTSAAQ